jgi:N,N'-diacetyllegionaminate synthase
MKTIIIAEAGVNHNGSFKLAKLLVDKAKEANVDYVKFQIGDPVKVTSKYAQMANYQKNNIGAESSQLDMIKKISLSYEDHKSLFLYCKQSAVKYLCTPFELNSIDFLKSLHLGLWKIPSGEITNYPYLKKIAQTGEPVILSTGMCTMEDVENAIDILTDNGTAKNEITVLHCNTEYPTPMEDVNLRAMQTISQKLGVKVGYSDHTLGIEVPIAAVALGATVIEKHFTLDRNMKGPDHKASLEPDELKAMVLAIRNIERAMGTGDKVVTDSERKNMTVARKSIVALTRIKKGDLFSETNISVKRPGSGISPMLWESVLGQIAPHDFEEDELIEL